jgi:hypothetical protein
MLLQAGLLGVGSLVGTVYELSRIAQQEDWYQHLPTPLVFLDAQFDSRRAIDLLKHRFEAGSLSSEQRSRLAKLTMYKFWAVPPPAHQDEWYSLAGRLAQKGALEPVDEIQYFTNVAFPQLDVRQRVCTGDPIVAELRVEQRSGDLRLHLHLETKQRFFVDRKLIAEQTSQPDRPIDLPICNQAPYWSICENVGLAVGMHTAEYETEYTIYWRNGRRIGDPPLHRGAVRATAEFEVLPADAPDPIEIVEVVGDPPPWLVHMVAWWDRSYEWHKRGDLIIESTRPLPMAIGGEVILAWEDQVQILEPMLAIDGKQNLLWVNRNTPASWPMGQRIPCEVIIRPDREAAARTVD